MTITTARRAHSGTGFRTSLMNYVWPATWLSKTLSDLVEVCFVTKPTLDVGRVLREYLIC